MNSSIITIGDEILIGQIVDTNSAYIASQLNNIGFRIDKKLSIGDSAEQITSTLDQELEHHDLVIITGGLGPTKDDITKTTLASYFGTTLEHNEHVAKHIGALMAQRGIAFNLLNQGQAMLPKGCTILFNRHGTAPGMWFEHGSSVVISLPGVPFEMKALMQEEVIPRLKAHFALKDNVHKTMISAGLAESILAEHIAAWESALPDSLHLAYLPSFGRVRLRLSAYQVETNSATAEIDKRFKELESLLGGYFVGYETASIEQLAHDILTASGKSLAVAESCTGGAISSKFTAMAGASAYFLLGATTYSNHSKEQVLSVDSSLIEKYGAVSEQVAQAMAEGARAVSGSDYAISTTGIAGPSGGSDQKPVGTVWFGFASAKHSFAVMKHCGTERSQIIGRATNEAITLLNKELREI